MVETTTLVLSGGNALGAYQAGAFEALSAAGIRPDRIVAASIGAVTAAIVAGNPPERRIDALRRFWDEAALDASAWAMQTAFWSDDRARALRSAIFGSPTVFRPRLPGALSMLPGMPGDASLYDLSPLRATLERVIDFGRLNAAELPLTIVAVDVITGEEVRFDTAQAAIGPDHLLASSGFLPFFPPVEIDGRLLCDGGMGANLPLEAALAQPSAEDRLCIAIDLFSRRGDRPRTVGQAVDRQIDLLLSSQTWKAVESLRRIHGLRRQLSLLGERLPSGATVEAVGAVNLLLLSHRGVPHDVEMKAFDYSHPVIAERREAGRTDMERALRELGSERAGPGEFVLRTVDGGARR